MRYRFIEHTADIAMEIYGKTVEELLRNATLAFRDAFIFPEKLEEKETRKIELKMEEDSVKAVEYLLYDWMNELLYLFDAEHFGVVDAEVKINGKNVIGKLTGGKLKDEAVKVEPKAITLHKFKVDKNDYYKAFLIIDI